MDAADRRQPTADPPVRRFPAWRVWSGERNIMCADRRGIIPPVHISSGLACANISAQIYHRHQSTGLDQPTLPFNRSVPTSPCSSVLCSALTLAGLFVLPPRGDKCLTPNIFFYIIKKRPYTRNGWQTGHFCRHRNLQICNVQQLGEYWPSTYKVAEYLHRVATHTDQPKHILASSS